MSMFDFIYYMWQLLTLSKLAVILVSICSMATWEHTKLWHIHNMLYKLVYIFVCVILECLHFNLGKGSSFSSSNQNSKSLCSFWFVIWLACSHTSLVFDMNIKKSCLFVLNDKYVFVMITYRHSKIYIWIVKV